MSLDLRLGDVMRLRRPHACGTNEWHVVRLGADIGLRCAGCGHRIMLARQILERRVVEFISRGEPRLPPEEMPLR